MGRVRTFVWSGSFILQRKGSSLARRRKTSSHSADRGAGPRDRSKRGGRAIFVESRCRGNGSSIGGREPSVCLERKPFRHWIQYLVCLLADGGPDYPAASSYEDEQC